MSEYQAYYVPATSKWPIVATIGIATTLIGFGLLLTTGGGVIPAVVTMVGALLIAYMMFGWFANVIAESRSGKYSQQMDRSFRWGMFWFIVSEVFFFAAFFFALWYVRQVTLPWLNGEAGREINSVVLWSEFIYQWPLLVNPDTSIIGPVATIEPLGLPLVNTGLLLSSSFTLTFAHNALKLNNRKATIIWMTTTVCCGMVFLYVQGYEYYEAYQHLGLTLASGIYGATFFMLTGFHGLHVTMGTIMLFVILLRLCRGHFSKENHFGFEGVAWYWHFVDVVWVGLFIFVYIL